MKCGKVNRDAFLKSSPSTLRSLDKNTNVGISIEEYENSFKSMEKVDVKVLMEVLPSHPQPMKLLICLSYDFGGLYLIIEHNYRSELSWYIYVVREVFVYQLWIRWLYCGKCFRSLLYLGSKCINYVKGVKIKTCIYTINYIHMFIVLIMLQT